MATSEAADQRAADDDGLDGDSEGEPERRRHSHIPGKRLLRLPQVLVMIGLSKSMVGKIIKIGEFPQPRKIHHATVWVESELKSWIEEIVSPIQPIKNRVSSRVSFQFITHETYTSKGLRAECSHVDHEAIFHIAFNHAFVGLVDFVHADHLDVRRDAMLAAKIEHFLRFRNAADQRTSQRTALENQVAD